MDKIAFIIGETFLYWNPIILMVAVAAAVCMFLAFYLRKPGNGLSAALLVPLAAALSLVLSRLVHWYCRADAYASMEAALTTYVGGSYALMGAFAGCMIAACVLRILCVHKNLPYLFDCMALGGAVGICVGRLASLFTNSDRGMVMDESIGFPLVYPVTNTVTGAVEYRLATFMLQSIFVGGLFLVLAVFYIVGKSRRKLKDGDTALLFLAAYGASQVLFDSTRYDSLYLRSNGFISVVQILGAVALVAALVIFSVRMVKSMGWKMWFPGLWLLAVAFIGGAAYMEYYVQRHGDQALMSYSVMGACLIGVVTVICVIRLIAVRQERKLTLVETNNE